MATTYPRNLLPCALWEGDDQTITGIASRLDLELSTITPLMNRLEQAGFAVRKRNPDGERQVKVRLTDHEHDLRKKTRVLTETLHQTSGVSIDALVDLNTKIKALRDASRGG